MPKKDSKVNHPKHYNLNPGKCLKCSRPFECIDVIEHMPFNIGNAWKYTWRMGLKSDNAIEELEKAVWYLKREISRLKRLKKKSQPIARGPK